MTLTFIQNEEIKHRKIEKQRITSDNYRIYLYQEFWKADGTIDYGSQPLLTFTNTSLTHFTIEADDEVKKKCVCTRKEPMIIVYHKGFNMDFTFAKTTDDISSMMFQQYIMYHGTASSLGHEGQSDDKNPQDGVTVFQKQNEINYMFPTYMLQIETKHYNAIEEKYQLKNCQFFKFKQTVEENSADITESFQGFAPYAEYESFNTQNIFKTANINILNGLLKGKGAKKYILNSSPKK